MFKDILKKTNLFVLCVIITGFAVMFVFNYFVKFYGDMEKIENISQMTEEGIYYRFESSIFENPVSVSLIMANDNFLRDYLQKETLEADDAFTKTIKDYLNVYKEEHGFDAVSLVSAKTRRYYNFNGVDRMISEENSEDSWYFELLKLNKK